MTSRRTAVGLLCALAGPAPVAWSAAPPASPAVLRIGFQKASANLVIVKQQRLLEQRLPTTQVQWLEFPAGPQLLEALAVNALDFGLTGDTPPVFAQSAGKDLVYVGAEPAKPLSSALLVPSGSPLRTLADLRGRRVAFQKGSSAHYLVLRALERAQLRWSDIVPIYLPPADARAAFERGSVDAWAIWDPFYAATELSGQPRVLANGVGLSGNNSFYLASRKFAEEQPRALKVLFDALTEADAFVQSHRKEAAALIAEFSGLNLATVHLFVSRRPPSPVGPLGPKVVADQQRVADTFARAGLIPKPVNVADLVWQPGRALPAVATR